MGQSMTTFTFVGSAVTVNPRNNTAPLDEELILQSLKDS